MKIRKGGVFDGFGFGQDEPAADEVPVPVEEYGPSLDPYIGTYGDVPQSPMPQEFGRDVGIFQTSLNPCTGGVGGGYIPRGGVFDGMTVGEESCNYSGETGDISPVQYDELNPVGAEVPAAPEEPFAGFGSVPHRRFLGNRAFETRGVPFTRGFRGCGSGPDGIGGCR